MHGGGSHGTAAAKHSTRLAIALAMTATYMVAEIVGGLITGSLALLADAAHMATDVVGLGLALLAIRFAARPATPQRTYGFLRMEVLSALTNAVILLLLTIYIIYEAYQRFLAPPEILSGPMLIVALIGLAVNLVSMWLLMDGSKESLNVKGAYFEVLGDMLGSVGVIAASLIIMFTGWQLADPLIGAGIGLFIVPRTWILLKQAVNILMEATPANVDVEKMTATLGTIPGVTAVHDLHVWTITSGTDAMSGHLVVQDASRWREVLREAQTRVRKEFGIDHVTIQVEDEAMRSAEAQLGF
ncbi:cation transporter [Rhodopseudomonas boonkerdii]|uniref:cation diffusion facilitator family transporter n=1 Tax=Rhodopseudomonas boonkerdii TaxID=475937 RepID=UPI001E53720E|nr:cation diffusion facilitator family transporter [Rhodopseudomonas boonkerdii]UGV26970.1 cation transporter [Rhodopseudomonas boonkerdii]